MRLRRVVWQSGEGRRDHIMGRVRLRRVCVELEMREGRRGRAGERANMTNFGVAKCDNGGVRGAINEIALKLDRKSV